MRLVPLKTHVETELARDVSRMAQAQGRSVSVVIADILRARLAAGSAGVTAAAADTSKRQLNRIEADGKWVVARLKFMQEAMLLQTRLWLEHNPRLDPAVADSIAASAMARFERFVDHALQAVAQGGTDLAAIAPPLVEHEDTSA